MIVSVGTQDSITRLARALESLGTVANNHNTRITENGGVLEEILLILLDLRNRVEAVENTLGLEVDKQTSLDNWHNEGGYFLG